MSAIYRITSNDGIVLGEADSVDGVVEVVKSASPGRYRIEEVSPNATTGDLQSWEWGAIIKSFDGQITLDVPPWLD